jgi:hypothetical protein
LLLDLLLPLQILAKRDPMDLNEPDRDDWEGHRQRQVHCNGCIQLQVDQEESQKPSADHNRSDSK